MTKNQRKDLRDLLERLQYKGAYTPAGPECPECQLAWVKYGHREHCELKRQIDLLKKEIDA